MRPEDDPSSPQAWLVRARSNLNLADSGRYIPGVLLEDLCFDAQQAAEKALKAICIFHSLDFPRTHSLASLLDILEAGGISIPVQVRDVVYLTQYAVRTRYPGAIEPISVDEYQAALALATGVVAWAEEVISGEAR